MSENYSDPSGNTQAFRAFVNSSEAEAPAAPRRMPLIVSAVIVIVLLVALVAWLALG